MAAPITPPVTIRAAQAEDVVAIARLGAHVFSTTFGHSVPAHELQAYLDESYSIEAVTCDVEDPAKDMFVATKPGIGVIGFALLTRGSSEPCIAHLENYVELQRIYVHPEHHGGGVGKLLAHAVEKTARDQGFTYMWLGVWEENHKARKVYERLGYRMVGDHDFVIGEVVQTDNIMLKEL